MGTSNLYKGPKGNALLPSDYIGEPDNQDLDTGQDAPAEGDDQPDDEELTQENNTPKVSWTSAKHTFSNQIGKRNPDVRSIAKTYTKASGGYKRAAKTSASSKRVAGNIITLFSGTPEAIRQRIEQIGVVFDGRTTKEVFNDLYSHLCAGSALREEAVTDRALSETFSELFESELMTDQALDMFKPELLEFLVTHFITNSIYYKLLNEVAFGELTGDKSTADITRIEQDLKAFIDGLVNGRVPEHLREGITHGEVNKLVDELYEDCYKVMEGME